MSYVCGHLYSTLTASACQVSEVKMKKCGIYKITNLVNNYFYVGSSVNIGSRFSNHRSTLRHNRHINPKLQNAWNKYGENNFEFKIIEICDPSKVYQIEQKYLNKIQKSYNVYNIVFMVGGFPNQRGDKNPRWVNVIAKNKKLIKKYWKQYHSVKTIQFMRDRFGYGGQVARRIIREIRKELDIPNRTKDNRIHHFKNLKTKDTFVGIRQRFIKKYNISYVTVSELILGTTIQTRTGWTLN